MDPWTQGVITGLIANGLTTLAIQLGQRGTESLDRKEKLVQTLKNDTALSPILQKAAASVAGSVKGDDERQTEKLRIFLVSPETEEVVRQIYASQLSMQSQGANSYLEGSIPDFLGSKDLPPW